jgi:SAM-dependent methyltransferase
VTARPGDRWREMIAARAVPEEISGRAPGPPRRGLEPERFRWRPEVDAAQPERPSRRRALEALPEGGSALDVGCGGGASSLGLGQKAGLIVGVDRSEAMLASFEESARKAGINVRSVQGDWPAVGDEVEPVDVAVSHHAVYGVAEIEAFLEALTAHARHRAVLEVSVNGPQAVLAPLWKAFHGVERPLQPVADLAEELLRAMGYDVEREDTVAPPRADGVTPEAVAFARRRLFVGPERDPEIEAFLRRAPQEHRVVALWWSGRA